MISKHQLQMNDSSILSVGRESIEPLQTNIDEVVKTAIDDEEDNLMGML